MQNQAQHFHKTRIAPTPSGYLHLGNVLSFSLTAALAKKTDAKILLRIDDLDRERANKLYIHDIFDTLNFLAIPWHEGPLNMHDYESNWSQVHRMPIYEKALQHLKDNNAIFACTCSRTQMQSCTCRQKALPFDAANTCWRLITDNQAVAIKTLNNETIRASLPDAMHNFVVKKKDGYPAYQLASLIDDLHFGIDLVVRGEDLWPSTIAQHYLALLLDMPEFQKITFHHHALIMASADKKLSKSAGATSINYLRKQGKKQVDIYTAIAGL
ncbi:MAG TPA: glutamate--tRNA ligase family protein [Mucilaginibacter sp.]